MIDDFLPSGGSPKLGLSQRKPKNIKPMGGLKLQPAGSMLHYADTPQIPASELAESNDPVETDNSPAPEATLGDWGETPQAREAEVEAEPVEPDTTDIPPALEPADDNDKDEPKPKKRSTRFTWPFSRKVTIIGALVAVLLLTGGTMAALASRSTVKSGVSLSKRPPKPAPKITTVASTLSGLQVDKSVNDRPVVAAMIENSLDARPQSGLDQASIVYEALAEGGVTRFMAVFQDTQPTYIGPIRSARPYYVQWALGYDAAYAHVGGSPDALQDIKDWNVRDLNQFYNAAAYNRVSTREAPHNVYTSVPTLAQLAQSKGYKTSSFTGFARKPEAKSKMPTTTSIDFSFSGPIYNPHFDYVAATNSYNRSENNAPHMAVDATGAQKQISPKVVVGIVVPESQGALDSSGAYYSDYNPIGSGQAYVFQDGILTMGTWSKTAKEAPLTLTDATNKPLKLNPGQTWISAVTAPGNITYK